MIDRLHVYVAPPEDQVAELVLALERGFPRSSQEGRIAAAVGILGDANIYEALALLKGEEH